MEKDRTINKWFDETLSQIKPIRMLDLSLIGILNCARKYCNGILVLLGNHHKMPAAALLRILCELYVKVLWCFQESDKADEPDKDSIIFQRFQRWDYSRVVEQKKLLKNISSVSFGDYKQTIANILKGCEESIEKYKTQKLHCMPNAAQIFKDIPQAWGMEAYSKVYQRFSGAVHLDMGLMRETVQHAGEQIQCFSDPPSYKTNELLLYCISIACDINSLLRRHYGWDSDEIQYEYDTIARELDKKKKDD